MSSKSTDQVASINSSSSGKIVVSKSDKDIEVDHQETRSSVTKFSDDPEYQQESTYNLINDASNLNFSGENVKTEEDIKKLMENYHLTPNDSNDPSFSHLKLPYSVICRQRYRKAQAKMKSQYIKELRAHAMLRLKAIDGVRIYRMFCDPVISPPKSEERIVLTRDQQERLNKLLRD